MDTLTHIVIGACIGEAMGGKQLGKKALVLGAIAQSIPDIDFIATAWLPLTNDLLAHRGFTHSLLFAAIVTPVLGWSSGKTFKTSGLSHLHWAFFWGLQIMVHLFLDAFNAYGTGWLEPFSHARISFNTMYVADILFSIWPGIAFIALLVMKMNSTKRIPWVKFGLGMSTLYLMLGIVFKLYIDQSVKPDLQSKNIKPGQYFITPTPLNNLLWYIVARNDSGYFIGYRSVFDKPGPTNFHFAYRNDSLLNPVINKDDANNLLQFSQGYYSIQKWHDTLVFNDLRFGEILGWAEPEPKFVFYYFLQYPDDNELIVQRGRFAKWDKAAFMTFLKRIKGV